MSKIIGIDLGTSNSAAAVMEGDKAKIIPSTDGTAVGYGKAFPSYVAWTKDDQLLVGEPARRQAAMNPDRTFQAFKRKMGSDHKFKLADKDYTPQQLSAFVLQKIKKDAEAYLGETVTKAVITVPAYFDDTQRQATKDAGKIAGLEVERIINEPTAAALAYGVDKTDTDETILVYDMGGGTLDVTIMGFSDGVFEVESTSGDTELGGTDMDQALLDYIIAEFKSTEGVDLSQDSQAEQRVREAAEKAKIELSSAFETDLNLPFITTTDEGPKHLVMKITRAKLEELIKPIVEKSKQSIQTAIEDAKLSPDKISKVIMVGGPTRIPLVQKFVEDYVGEGKIARGIDPMECVAMGASIQGGVLRGDVKDVTLLDVTPLSLGIETMGGVATKLIPRNTTVPTSKSQVFSTAADNQPSVEVHVVQGEREMSADNKSLGRFILSGIAPAPRGVPQIEVTFDIDANGILNVKAKDKGTGQEQKITISGSSALSEEEVEKMRKDAETHAADDKKRKELIEKRNESDQVIYQAEKLIKDAGDKVKADDKKKMEDAIQKLKDVKDKDNVDDLKKELENLNQVMQTTGASLYQSAQGDPAQAAGQTTGGDTPKADEKKSDDKKKDENVVDADFEEKK